MSSYTYRRHYNSDNDWNNPYEELQFNAYKVESQPERYTSSPQRPKHHQVEFKNDHERVRESERNSPGHRLNGGSENIDKEATDFIKREHEKFQSSRTTS
ncbi:hypothetical protein PanWU01x14_240620 [Parasponia andersonii]|uniref:Uncharacterized protein n=1 Tax=Parasponia andersonii TaxID=3476 RepID=A0A2P5BGR7_PARAD|nr:hypothetical protein PanWU01x14_240620 [Parasponia andersonii]